MAELKKRSLIRTNLLSIYQLYRHATPHACTCDQELIKLIMIWTQILTCLLNHIASYKIMFV